SWKAFGHALRGLSELLAGRTEPGLDKLHAVLRETGSTEANWLYPQLHWVHGLGHLFAGSTDETLESAHGALVSNREWGIFWGMPYAVELSAIALDRVGQHGIAARALGSVDAAYNKVRGKSPSAYPDTILHDFRLAIESRPRAREEHLRGSHLTLADMADELILHLQPVHSYRADEHLR
ncbi:MAG: hypothetical protein QOJ19_1126, partial [Acidimicrobiia bacterium]|nr:hypothetical protein [Acidimicrobiia bacterium]